MSRDVDDPPARDVESAEPRDDANADDAHALPDKHMLQMLVCPLTKTQLVWKRDSNELLSYAARLAFPIRKSIPLLYVGEARELSDEELQNRQQHKPVGFD